MVEKAKAVVPQGVRIEDLPVNPQAPLTGEVRTQLVKIIEAEFNAQSTVYNSKMQEEQDRILERHKRRLGFHRFMAELEALNDQAEALDRKKNALLLRFKDTPFEANGNFTQYNLTPVGTKEYNVIRAELDAVGLKHPMNLKNKIITRLLIATTMGEALVILRQVLGNGLLPNITREQLQLEQK